MLRHRVLTALVLIPLVIAATLLLDTRWMALLLGGVTLLGGWEWARLGGLRGNLAAGLFVAILAMLLVGGWLLLQQHSPLALDAALLALAWWVLAGTWVVVFQASGGRAPPAPGPWTVRLVGLLVLVTTWSSAVAVHALDARGPQLLLYLLFLVWIADSGAYFSGRRWGRRKLARHVSPGKSWEGVAGGLLPGSVFAVAGGFWFGLEGGRLAGFVVLAAAVVAVGVLGDLFESLLKRYRQVKDSGGLLPGHGGVLDRIDSLTAATPLCYCGLLLLGVHG